MMEQAVRTLTSACPLDCPDSCSLEVDVAKNAILEIRGTKTNPFTDGFICHKVRHFGEHVHGPERLHTPLRRVGDKASAAFEPISWEAAMAEVASRLQSIRAKFGGEAILPYSYGGSNGYLTHQCLDARLFRRLGASRLLRTVCAAATSRAWEGLYGKMQGVAMEDYLHARLIVLWGMNPSASGIHLVPVVQRAQKAGAKLVVIDPRATPLAKQADLHLAPMPGTDLPLALSIHRWLFENGKADFGFLALHCAEVDKFRARLHHWTIDDAADLCRIKPARIEAFAKLYAESDPAVIRCGWGPERNRNGGSAIAAILALPAVAGKFGVRGGGFTMSNSSAWKITTESVINEPEPSTRKLNMNLLGDALCTLDRPPIKGLVVYNSNALATSPDQNRIQKGLLRDDLFTVVLDQVMTDTARYADIVLPVTTFLEHDELRRGYGATPLYRTRGVIPPVGQSRSNNEIFGELLARLHLEKPGDETDPEKLTQRLLDSNGDGPRLQYELDSRLFADPAQPRPILFVDVFPCTPDRLVHLVPAELDAEAPKGLYHYQPDPRTEQFPLTLISPSTGRLVSSSLGELWKTLVPLEMHPGDAASRSIADGQRVRAFNEWGEVVTIAKLNPDVRPGVVMLHKGLWRHHTLNGSTANALSPSTLSDVGANACFNDARVEVEANGP